MRREQPVGNALAVAVVLDAMDHDVAAAGVEDFGLLRVEEIVFQDLALQRHLETHFGGPRIPAQEGSAALEYFADQPRLDAVEIGQAFRVGIVAKAVPRIGRRLLGALLRRHRSRHDARPDQMRPPFALGVARPFIVAHEIARPRNDGFQRGRQLGVRRTSRRAPAIGAPIAPCGVVAPRREPPLFEARLGMQALQAPLRRDCRADAFEEVEVHQSRPNTASVDGVFLLEVPAISFSANASALSMSSVD
jgi:hypothetical protein